MIGAAHRKDRATHTDSTAAPATDWATAAQAFGCDHRGLGVSASRGGGGRRNGAAIVQG